MRPAAPAQAAFAAALLDPAAAPPQGLQAWNGAAVGARFAVHRNNVVVSLVQALADAFPVVQRLVGEAFFAALAGVFVRAHPPRSPVLADWGDGFADWLARFAPAAALPYLPDVARLERARTRAYHAADVAALDAQAIGQRLAATARLAQARIELHPSLTTIVSDWAVVSLWFAHQQAGEDAVAAVDPGVPESALVLREGDDVLVVPVGRADAAFVQALQAAQPLAAAIATATREAGGAASFELASALSRLIRHGAVTAWHDPGDPP
jgi:Putative DNA-binding domain